MTQSTDQMLHARPSPDGQGSGQADGEGQARAGRRAANFLAQPGGRDGPGGPGQGQPSIQRQQEGQIAGEHDVVTAAGLVVAILILANLDLRRHQTP